MKLIKRSLFLMMIGLFAINISGCTLFKEMFLSDITKDLCEQKNWSVVGEYALDKGKYMDSFYEYQAQCRKYFSINISNDMIDSFNLGYERARPSYCTNKRALTVGQRCGYYNIHACKGIVSEDLLLELFDAFQEGNETCIASSYSDGEFAASNNTTCP